MIENMIQIKIFTLYDIRLHRSNVTNNGLCLCWGRGGEDCFITGRDKIIFQFLSHELSLSFP